MPALMILGLLTINLGLLLIAHTFWTQYRELRRAETRRQQVHAPSGYFYVNGARVGFDDVEARYPVPVPASLQDLDPRLGPAATREMARTSLR